MMLGSLDKWEEGTCMPKAVQISNARMDSFLWKTTGTVVYHSCYDAKDHGMLVKLQGSCGCDNAMQTMITKFC